MAAVVCQSIGQLCKGCLNCVVWPCKKGCELCGTTCHLCTDILCSPFVPYLFTTLALNIPPAVFGARGASVCDSDSGRLWLFVNAILACVHIAGAFYIVVKIQGDEDGSGGEQEVITATVVQGDRNSETKQQSSGRLQKNFPTAPPPSNQQGGTTLAGSVKRMGQVMCHDMGVAIYIVMATIWTFWQLYGIAQLFQIDDEDDQDPESACDARGWVSISLGCGFLYMVLVGCAFGCSLCCLRRS